MEATIFTIQPRRGLAKVVLVISLNVLQFTNRKVFSETISYEINYGQRSCRTEINPKRYRLIDLMTRPYKLGLKSSLGPKALNPLAQ